MKPEIKSKYLEYIAGAIRHASKESQLKWPDDAILVVKSYSVLSGINEIVGLKIFIMDMPSSLEFFVAFPSETEKAWKLQKYFLEFVETYDLEI